MNDQTTSSVNALFLQQAREYISGDFLPKIEKSIESLSAEEVWWRANEESNSIGNLLLHLAGNARQWIVCGVGGAADKRTRQQEFDERSVVSRTELLAKLRGAIAEVDGVLASFDVSGILERRLIQ